MSFFCCHAKQIHLIHSKVDFPLFYFDSWLRQWWSFTVLLWRGCDVLLTVMWLGLSVLESAIYWATAENSGKLHFHSYLLDLSSKLVSQLPFNLPEATSKKQLDSCNKQFATKAITIALKHTSCMKRQGLFLREAVNHDVIPCCLKLEQISCHCHLTLCALANGCQILQLFSSKHTSMLVNLQ